ncbi:MAG: ABC transporter ATP-binding protein [Alphaproteobacteria bacterium]|nr:ABC transporter ATP-binding protein [Alphaproteobacteria bacterium]
MISGAASVEPTHSSIGVAVAGAGLSFAGRTIFQNVSLTLAAGEWTALLGPSGVGKTSLLRLIAGLPEDGGVTVGSVQASDGYPLAGRIAYMAQRDLLLPWLSIIDNVLIGVRLRRHGNDAKDRQKALHLLDQVGLAARAQDRPAALSGGMRQRVALARTLMEDRPLVLMDEPFSALDAVTRFRLQETAARLLSGRTVLLVTHDPSEALRLSDRIALLAGTPVQLTDAGSLPDVPIPRPLDAPGMAARAASLLQQLADQDARDTIATPGAA